MVGAVGKTSYAVNAIKFYILRDREKQRQEDETKAEKIRRKNDEYEKKLRIETEFKATHDKITELTKKYEHLKSEKIRVFEYLKRVLTESKKYCLEMNDIAKLNEIGLVVPTAANHQYVRTFSRAPSPILIETPTVSLSDRYKSSKTSILPAQEIPTPKRNRSPSPVYRDPYAIKQQAGPLPFQKLEYPRRNHEYNRSHLYTKPESVPPSSNYGSFYPSSQNIAYSHPPQPMPNGVPVNNNYANRDNVDSLHKSQPPAELSPSSPRHSSLYAHRLPESSGPPPSIPSNHVYHPKNRAIHPDEKYYMVRPEGHIPVHGILSIQHQSQVAKNGSITSGYSVRSVETRMNPPRQMYIRPVHGDHHSSPSSLSSHRDSQSHQPHYPVGGVLSSHSSSRSFHSLQQVPSSVSSHRNLPHHPRRIQQMYDPPQPHHLPAHSHHQLLSSHPADMHHPSHRPWSLHHEPHIQRISTHLSTSQRPLGQQSQPISAVTSQPVSRYDTDRRLSNH